MQHIPGFFRAAHANIRIQESHMHKLGQLLPADRTGLRLLDAVIGSDSIGILIQLFTNSCSRQMIFFIICENQTYFLFALITIISIFTDISQSLEFFAAHRADFCSY